MYMSNDREVQIYFNQVVQLVGQRVGIEDAMWKSPTEVFQLFEENKNILNQLNLFFQSYEAWWEYDKKLEAKGKMGRLTTEEFKERDDLASKRDITRNTLIGMLP
jgi:hypothetical protein